MTTTISWEDIETKVQQQERLTPEEGVFLLREANLLELGALAEQVRYRKLPAKETTFVIDSNPNYTNICDTDCSFCAFYRKPGDPDAYWLTVEQVMEKIQHAADLGATTVLLQGGHNTAIPFDYYVSLIRETRRRFPQVTPHFFTASEVQTMARVSGMAIQQVLAALKATGQYTLPGGGAEILSERVRQWISPKKGPPEKWLEVHRAAHQLGFRSTATMMYGHVETAEDIVTHWNAIRELQDETRGFTAFVPWSFKPGHTRMFKKIPERAGATQYLRILAASRLYLDNFDHIQASWFSEGKKTGQVALHFGADDFGGTIFEENVHEATGWSNDTTVEGIVGLIRDAGFAPVQRTTLYERVKVW